MLCKISWCGFALVCLTNHSMKNCFLGCFQFSATTIKAVMYLLVQIFVQT